MPYRVLPLRARVDMGVMAVEGEPHSQSFSITGNSPSDCLVSYSRHLLGGGSYPSAEMQSVYSRAPTDWASPGYDTKQSDGEVPVMLEVCRMQSAPSFSSFPGLLCPRVAAPVRVLSICQIDINCVHMQN